MTTDRDQWLAQVREDILEPDLPICDPHHHLWDHPGRRYLIDELIAHATARQFVYTHRWRLGDLVMWDDRCTMHRGTDFDDLRWKRDMQRATVSDVANSCEPEGIGIEAAAGSKATFESAATNCGKSESEAAESFRSSKQFWRDLAILRFTHSNRPADMRDRQFMSCSASCTAINDEIGTTSTC
jgi:hypothetical protein